MNVNDTKTYSARDIAKMIKRGDYVPTAAGAKPGPALDRAFWDNAGVVMPGNTPKVPISLRVDHEVLTWFKSSGKGYLSRMNTVLLAYVKAQK